MLLIHLISTCALISTTTALSAYVPYSVVCPQSPLVRPAEGLSTEEKTYRTARKAKADLALKEWLRRTDPSFGAGSSLPTIGLTSSGGGLRSLLTSAGVVQGLDARDSSVSTSGLYQALTYHTGLSGGAWMLSSMAGNNYPTISNLKETLWKDAFQNSVLDPGILLSSTAYIKVLVDLTLKTVSGFGTTVVDAYGRFLSYQLLKGFNGGVATTLSSVASLSNFTACDAPFPIITAVGAKAWEGECTPGPNGTQYEFSPYEFGSWSQDVSAFTPTKYLGSALENGKPQGTMCKNNYDNLGFVMGTSSNIFPAIGCVEILTPQDRMADLFDVLVGLVSKVNLLATTNFFALYANPFYNYQSPTCVRNLRNNIQSKKTLYLVDGGAFNFQNNPIFPLLQPSRGVDVILVNDNTADTNNFPNGSEIFTTYMLSLDQKLTHMPYIPPVETFLAQGLHQKAVFFGCGARDKATIIWLPNAYFTYASNTPTTQLIYQKDQTDKMIANGVQVATQGDDEDWGLCLACGIMMKHGSIPRKCDACLANYCYKK